MALVKDKVEYVDLKSPFTPQPKYGHLSEPRPEWVQQEPHMQKIFDGLWALPSWSAFREAAGHADAAIPAGGPDRERDIVTEIIKFPARDGHMIELKVYRSPKVQPDATLMLRMHGGGFCVGTHETDGAENVYAAANHNIVCVSVDYRLAPEHPFPYPFNDSFDALLWCKSNSQLLGVNPERIIVGGSSAGATLAATIALEARDQGVTGILAQVLHFPSTCHPRFVPNDRFEFGSLRQNADNCVLSGRLMETFSDAFTPNASPDQRHSPLLAQSLKDLPPTLIQLAGLDVLRDGAFAYGDALVEAGVSVEVHAYSGLPHCFPGYMLTLQDTIDFYGRYGRFLERFSQ